MFITGGPSQEHVYDLLWPGIFLESLSLHPLSLLKLTSAIRLKRKWEKILVGWVGEKFQQISGKCKQIEKWFLMSRSEEPQIKMHLERGKNEWEPDLPPCNQGDVQDVANGKVRNWAKNSLKIILNSKYRTIKCPAYYSLPPGKRMADDHTQNR